MGKVVQRLHCDPTGQGGVAEHGDHMFFAALKVAGGGHSQRSGKGRSGVARPVTVIFTLGPGEETAVSTGLSNGVESIVIATGQKLLHVALMGNIEDQAVLWRIEKIMKGDGQLNHSQVLSEVPAIDRGDRDQSLPYFICESRKILDGYLLQVIGVADVREKGLLGLAAGFLIIHAT